MKMHHLSEAIKSAMVLVAIAVLFVSAFLAFAGVPSESHPANAMWIESSSVDLVRGPIA